MNAQLKKGILDMCVLHIVTKNDEIYGYTLIKEMTVLFPEVNDSTVYSVLRRLYKSGNLEVTLKESNEGPPRKYYNLSKKGGELLKDFYDEWRRLKELIDSLEIY